MEDDRHFAMHDFFVEYQARKLFAVHVMLDCVVLRRRVGVGFLHPLDGFFFDFQQFLIFFPL